MCDCNKGTGPRVSGDEAIISLTGSDMHDLQELTEMGSDMARPARLSGRMAENQWFVASGFDPSTDVRIVYQQRGRHVHAWARVVMPGGPPFFIHATTDTAEIERQLSAHPSIRAQMTAAGGEASVGWFGSKIFKGIKKAAKKAGITKVVKTVRSLAAKAMNNPMVKQALASHPYGQAALAAYQGAKVANAALRGNPSAKNVITHLTKQYAAGNPQAATALKFIRAGARDLRSGKYGDALCSSVPTAVSGNDARSLLVLGDLCRAGNDSTDLGNDVDALLTFASAGAFEGARWLLDRMSLRSMQNHPNEFGTRAALMSGRDVLATRFA